MDHSVSNESTRAGHELSEVSPRLIIVSLAVLAVSTLLVLVLVVGIFRFLKSTSVTPATTAGVQQPLPPEPRIEIDAAQQFKGIRAREDHVLSSYAWVDQNQGVVRVPVDRAIDMLAQKGLASHDYLQDILAGKKAPAVAKAAEAKQGK